MNVNDMLDIKVESSIQQLNIVLSDKFVKCS